MVVRTNGGLSLDDSSLAHKASKGCDVFIIFLSEGANGFGVVSS